MVYLGTMLAGKSWVAGLSAQAPFSSEGTGSSALEGEKAW